jgi:hypothetical protein
LSKLSPEALTLRGFTLWLPMLPDLWIIRRQMVMAAASDAAKGGIPPKQNIPENQKSR